MSDTVYDLHIPFLIPAFPPNLPSSSVQEFSITTCHLQLRHQQRQDMGNDRLGNTSFLFVSHLGLSGVVVGHPWLFFLPGPSTIQNGGWDVKQQRGWSLNKTLKTPGHENMKNTRPWLYSSLPCSQDLGLWPSPGYQAHMGVRLSKDFSPWEAEMPLDLRLLL